MEKELFRSEHFYKQQILWASQDFKDACEEIKRIEKLLEGTEGAKRAALEELLMLSKKNKTDALQKLKDYYNGKA